MPPSLPPRGDPGPQWGQAARQSGFGPPPSGYREPSSGGRSKLPLLLAGAAVLLIAAVTALGVTLGFGDKSAEDTAEDFLSAAERHDCEAVYAMMSDSLQQDFGTCGEDTEGIVPPDVTFGAVSITDESDSEATATVKAESDGDTIPVTLKLIREDGDWKVHQIE